MKSLLGTVKEADGNTMCITESMWLSIPTSVKGLTEGFNRPRPAVQGANIYFKLVKEKNEREILQKLLKIINRACRDS